MSGGLFASTGGICIPIPLHLSTTISIFLSRFHPSSISSDFFSSHSLQLTSATIITSHQHLTHNTHPSLPLPLPFLEVMPIPSMKHYV